jgi:hypothetical protein
MERKEETKGMKKSEKRSSKMSIKKKKFKLEKVHFQKDFSITRAFDPLLH